MTSNETIAKNSLKSFWWDVSELRFGVSPSFEEIISQYQAKAPSFLVNLGSSLKYAGGQSRIRDAFKRVATEGGKRIPSYQDFFSALAGERLQFNWQDVKDVAEGTVKDFGKIASLGLGAALIVGAAVLALYLGHGVKAARSGS